MAVRVARMPHPPEGDAARCRRRPWLSSSVPWACPPPCVPALPHTRLRRTAMKVKSRTNVGGAQANPYLRGCSHITAAVELLWPLSGRPPSLSGHLPQVPSTAGSADGSGQPPLRAYGGSTFRTDLVLPYYFEFRLIVPSPVLSSVIY